MPDIARELGAETAGTGERVFLVNGAAPADAWGELPDLLKRDHQVVTYTRRSFPPSPGPQPDSHLEHTQDLAQLMSELGSGTVVGWSSGGVIAMALAIQRPDLVDGLVLIEPPLHMKRRPTIAMLGAVLGGILRGKRDPVAGARRFFAWALRHRDGSNDLDRLDPEELRRAAPAIVHEISLGTGEKEVPPGELSRIDAPAVWLVGSDGNSESLNSATRAKRRWPALTIDTVPGAAHAIQLSHPEAVAAAVRKVVAEAA